MDELTYSSDESSEEGETKDVRVDNVLVSEDEDTSAIKGYKETENSTADDIIEEDIRDIGVSQGNVNEDDVDGTTSEAGQEVGPDGNDAGSADDSDQNEQETEEIVNDGDYPFEDETSDNEQEEGTGKQEYAEKDETQGNNANDYDDIEQDEGTGDQAYAEQDYDDDLAAIEEVHRSFVSLQGFGYDGLTQDDDDGSKGDEGSKADEGSKGEIEEHGKEKDDKEDQNQRKRKGKKKSVRVSFHMTEDTLEESSLEPKIWREEHASKPSSSSTINTSTTNASDDENASFTTSAMKDMNKERRATLGVYTLNKDVLTSNIPKWYSDKIVTTEQIELFRDMLFYLECCRGGPKIPRLFNKINKIDPTITENDVQTVVDKIQGRRGGYREVDFDEFLYELAQLSSSDSPSKFSRRQTLFYTTITKFAITNTRWSMKKFYQNCLPDVKDIYISAKNYNKLRQRRFDKILRKNGPLVSQSTIDSVFSSRLPDVTGQYAVVARWAGFGEIALQQFTDLLAGSALATIDADSAFAYPQVWHDYLRDDFTATVPPKRKPWDPTDNLDRCSRNCVLQTVSGYERNTPTVADKLKEKRETPKPAGKLWAQKQLEQETAEKERVAQTLGPQRKRSTKLMDRRTSSVLHAMKARGFIISKLPNIEKIPEIRRILLEGDLSHPLTSSLRKGRPSVAEKSHNYTLSTRQKSVSYPGRRSTKTSPGGISS